MDQWVENDADQAVKKVYFEYLEDRYKDDPEVQSRRKQQFENARGNRNDHANQRDIAALDKARQAYLENHETGVAINAARDALYAHFDHEEIWRRTVDQNRASKDPEYHLRETARVEEEVGARRQRRLESASSLTARDAAVHEEQLAAPAVAVRSKLNQELDAEEDHQPKRDTDRSTNRAEISKLNESLDREEQAEKGRAAGPIEVSASDRLQFSRLNRMLDHEEQQAEKDHTEKGRGIAPDMTESKREMTSRISPGRTPRGPEVTR